MTNTKDIEAKKTLLHKGELSFGIFLGFCTGYFIKKVGKLFALMVGAGFMFLQYLSFNGFITIHWERLEGSYNRRLGVDKEGKVTTQAVRSKWKGFVGFLTHNLQFKSTFMVGLYGGLRYG
ncbi:FUN14 family-domain-containing protein [Absidia repens]|uniref:FUN14 family-domain-containing protein n=1 Tax=Absidia repens TaxID=90262 RepID=A0A1X2I9H0_9FUNG|nr:FUN14 family-domain-containing protein [Absidia repens]